MDVNRFELVFVKGDSPMRREEQAMAGVRRSGCEYRVRQAECRSADGAKQATTTFGPDRRLLE